MVRGKYPWIFLCGFHVRYVIKLPTDKDISPSLIIKIFFNFLKRRFQKLISFSAIISKDRK